ncbi:MAG: FAD-binding oxidoreductase [Rhodospirillaceae bacterium]|nr:FAD-binding oxidoreductase [Rhodospirillaceae bacterium]
MAATPHVLVVGAGIVGASIARYLAKAGARVTVVEAGEPGGVATRSSWAWINASSGNPEPYFRLRHRSQEEWRRVEREVLGLPVTWSGSLNWSRAPKELEAFAAERIAWGYDLRRVGPAEIRRLEPELAATPDLALHVPGEGSVEPVAAALAFLADARRLGASLAANTRVERLEMSGGRVVGIRTSEGVIDADEVVVASGTGTPQVLASSGVVLPMRRSPALLVRSRPQARLLNGLLVSPEMELRQTADGRLLAVGDIDDADIDDASKPAAALFEQVRALIRSGAALALDSHAVGYRPIPKDGYPAVGRAGGVQGLYVAVMHSGITLAPIVGCFACQEIVEGKRDPLLAPYGFDRFAGG